MPSFGFWKVKNHVMSEDEIQYALRHLDIPLTELYRFNTYGEYQHIRAMKKEGEL